MTSRMLEEALYSAQAVQEQEASTQATLAQLGLALAALKPSVALTIARGSSDHAASYFAYLVMQHLGVPTCSLPMSLLTLHSTPLNVKGQLAVAFSQSGQSPDLVKTMQVLRDKGAMTVALLNQIACPLAEVCEWVVPLCAGTEQSVAATKSYITMLSASARLIAYWMQDKKRLEALGALPQQLGKASHQNWSKAIEALQRTNRMMVVGRGLGLSIALEAALKFKEACALQAEAFSGAEIQHGPAVLVEEGYPLLIFALRGPEQSGLIELANKMREYEACVLLAAPEGVPGCDLPLSVADDEALDPLLAIQSFYVMAARLSVARGLNPDTPRHLSKVTLTR